MTENNKIITKTEEMLDQIAYVADNMATRTKNIDFSKDILDEHNVTDLKIHLAYTRNFSDLARVKLQYHKEMDNVERLTIGTTL